MELRVRAMPGTKVHSSNLFLRKQVSAALWAWWAGTRRSAFKVLGWTGWGRQKYLIQCFNLNQRAPVRASQEYWVQQPSAIHWEVRWVPRECPLCRARRKGSDDMISCPDKTQATCCHQMELAVVSQGKCVSLSAGCRDLCAPTGLLVAAYAFLTCLVLSFKGKSEGI